MTTKNVLLCIMTLSCVLFAQTKTAYVGSDSGGSGLFDTTRLSIHTRVSFDIVGGNRMGTQSQGLYSTMMTYRFNAPLLLNLDVGFPLFSTFFPAQNLSMSSISPSDYLKNMPIDVSLVWRPSEHLLFQVDVVQNPGYDFCGIYSPWNSRNFMPQPMSR